MCGRATLTTPIEEIAEQLGVGPIPIGPPRFNVAPGQPLLVLREGHDGGDRELSLLKWGLSPWWAKDERPKQPFIQARAETIATARPFRDAFQARRCLVVVDGFYEWSAPEGGKRRPHHIHRKDGSFLTLAGLWESYRTRDGEIVETCAVVTTAACGDIRALHSRMPFVLAPAAREAWLGGSPNEATGLLALAHESQTDRARELVVVPVSLRVNDVRNDDPGCLAPPGEETAPAPAPAAAAEARGQIALPFK